MEGRVFIGIDPGDSGAIAVIKNSSSSSYHPISDFIKIIEEIKLEKEAVLIAIEQPIFMPFQNVKATSKQWQNFGELIGVCKYAAVPYIHVHPKTWQKEVLPNRPVKKVGEKPEQYRKRMKLYCIEVMQRLFPLLNLSHKQDGVADALGIALWAKKYVG